MRNNDFSGNTVFGVAVADMDADTSVNFMIAASKEIKASTGTLA